MRDPFLANSPQSGSNVKGPKVLSTFCLRRLASILQNQNYAVREDTLAEE